MTVTPIGWVLLVVGLLLMVARPRWLYIATVFALPFTATGVINVGSGEDASAVQVSMYLGLLLIARHAAGLLRKGRLPFPRGERTSLIWLGLFIATTAASLIMPIWLDGHVLIPSPYLNHPGSQPLHLSGHNITGVLYMVYGYLFAYVVAVLNRDFQMLRLSLKSFIGGAVFAALWAIVELVCKVSGIPYPAVIFNTGTAGSTMGYKQFLAASVFRLSSVAVEPSIFAQTLLVALSLYLPFIFGKRTLFGKVLDRWMYALLFAVLCLTTSSTAYLGIFLGLLIAFVIFTRKGLLRIKHVVLTLTGVVVAALVWALVPVVRLVVDTVLLSKDQSYSALERLMTIQNSWEMFLRYPILGVGWESIGSHDMIVHILANAGIVGFLFFLGAIYAVFRGLYRPIKSRSKKLRVEGMVQIDFAMYVALAVTLLTSVISGFLNVFSFFWFTWGLAIAVAGRTAAVADDGPRSRDRSRQKRLLLPSTHRGTHVSPAAIEAR